ncbi:MAG TPA: cysteine synthase family protein [Candidatus Limnocylindrales bacterium]|nr:cysteine synthase family protein [Candidatus Limnocylindrales bacterium]
MEPGLATRPANVFEDIVDAIGNTPMVRIQSLSPDPTVRLYAKLEGMNPSGSVKDRIATALIDDLEARGELGPGKVLLESSSGNTGIALALVAHRRGYPLTVVMADNVSPERRTLVRAFGAAIIDSPGSLGSNGAIAKARDLARRDPSYALADQYGNEVNSSAHEASTGPEVLAQCPDIDVFVAGLGTSGTLMGVARYLKREKPGVKVVAAEPLPGAGVQGLRSLEDGFVPEIFDPDLLDRKLLVSNREAVLGVRALLAREGIFAGLSSGAILVAARRVARDMPGATIVALLPDGGWKYLSAGIFSANIDTVEEELESQVTAW